MRKIGLVGIYQITGPGGRVYVGQSVDIYGRWQEHRKLLRGRKHYNPKLQKAWNRFGETAFQFSILTLCAIKVLDATEQFYMDRFNAVTQGYNIAPIAGTSRGRKLPGVSARNRRLKGRLHPSYGKPRPDLAELNRARKGKPGTKHKHPHHSSWMKGRTGPHCPWYGRKRPDTSKRMLGLRQGSLHPLSKLTEADVREIRQLAKTEKQVDIARRFNISYTTVSKIVRLQSWKHVK